MAAVRQGLVRVKPWIHWLIICLIIAIVSSINNGYDWIIPDTIAGWSFAIVWGGLIMTVLIYSFLDGVSSYLRENQTM